MKRPSKNVTKKSASGGAEQRALEALRAFVRSAELRTVSGEKRIVLKASSARRVTALLSEARTLKRQLTDVRHERDVAEADLELSRTRAEALETIMRNAGVPVPEDPQPQAEPKGPWLHRAGGSFETGKRR